MSNFLDVSEINYVVLLFAGASHCSVTYWIMNEIKTLFKQRREESIELNGS